ncbi:MAG: ABC transporter permease [Candidatus Omnitrophica bacterium]|nr:ABC transporter permease [Candidatus Omnitrophota bacterium]MBI3010683.1 ABC transporter permease [Candidatus Omnitrophota bacterium]
MQDKTGSLRRIGTLLQRYVFLHRRSIIRVFDIGFWPVMDLLIWGFMMLYIQRTASTPLAETIIFLIGAMIAWDIHYRGQQAVTISLMEEIWTRNIVNILIAPLRLWEWVVASFLYGTLKVATVTLILGILAHLLYAFNLIQIGWVFLPLAASLLFFGWAIGLGTSGLLLRYGYAAEALIWGIPFLLQPFSCVFYPLEVLPVWAQGIARILPSTYAFEGLRQTLQGKAIPASLWAVLIGLNGFYLALGAGFFVFMFHRARATGRLGHLGQD